jgi:hypothetical protein
MNTDSEKTADDSITSQEKTIGFIILRCVVCALTNRYWNHSYDCIRKFYPENHILIIDDCSDKSFLNTRILHNTTVINSTYPKRGELLPYYYFLHNKLFDIAVILHDSAFINKYIDFRIYGEYRKLWDFEHKWDQDEDEKTMLNVFKDKELIHIHSDKNKWAGVFGGMALISHEYLESVYRKYDISLLLDVVLSRYNRCSFERVIGVLLLQKTSVQTSVFGDIHKYFSINGKFQRATFDDKEKYNHLSIIKIWTGR